MDPETVEQLLAEGAVPVAELAARMPRRRGKRVHGSTLNRWIVQGKGGVRLEGFAGHGAGYWSSPAALARFLAALTRRRGGAAVTPPPSPARAERAMAELRAGRPRG